MKGMMSSQRLASRSAMVSFQASVAGAATGGVMMIPTTTTPIVCDKIYNRQAT